MYYLLEYTLSISMSLYTSYNRLSLKLIAVIFSQIVMQFLYQGGCQTLEPASEDILELMAAANFFQLDGLLRYCESRCAAMVALDNVVSMYIHARVYNALQLLEYCQGFLLQNMVALLTYDDSVKRLLFAKKLPNHDVLAGLLSTLQNRIKARKNQGLCKLNGGNVPIKNSMSP